jgi:hypothetical protein
MTEIPRCGCCKTKRAGEGLPPREKIAVFAHSESKPIYLCTFCDGDALPMAQLVESKRISGQ